MQLIERLLRRKWTPEYLHRAVGEVLSTHFCYATDGNTRSGAASGGAVTTMLQWLLSTGRVDGALCVKSRVTEGLVCTEFFVARTTGDLAEAQGSKYMPVHFRDALPLIRDFKGKLAVVLLPCDARALHRLRKDDPAIDSKIELVIALFCGHNSERTLTDVTVRRYQADHGELVAFRHRFGHWRGKTRMAFEDGTLVVSPFSVFSDYQNLFFFSQKKCHACYDHTGFFSDLAAGDIWSQHMKSDPIKHTAIIVRSPRAAEVFSSILKAGAINSRAVSLAEVCDGQSRSLPFHYNVSARARVSRLFGMKLRDLTAEPVSWNETVVAFFVLLNERITRNAIGRRIVLAVPRPLLRLYLVFLKGLESL